MDGFRFDLVLLMVGMFTGIVLVLVIGLMLLKRQLVPQGQARIRINKDDDHQLTAPVGGTLLATLAAEKIFVPSACGGKGSCGVCKVTIRSGGGPLLPTEETHVSRAEARDDVRLSCQVKVKEDLELEVPPEVLSARQWACTVRSNRNVATFIKEVVLELPEGEDVPFRAGGYIQISVPPHRVRYQDFDIGSEYRAEWDKYSLWGYVSVVDDDVMRAYSMANYPEEKGLIKLNVRIASPPPGAPNAPPGQASSYIFALKPGDKVTISGPFGDFFARETDNEMCFIGGGAGMAPMRSLIFDQLKRLNTKRKMTFWYGARSLREAFYVDEFDRLAQEHDNFQWTLALSDTLPEAPWQGPRGFVHQVALDNYLSNHPSPEDIEYYLCGPPAMLAAVLSSLEALGVERENILFDDFG
jgi:Na+-transporting NADH:ubiquinone oxidoreductase subunit F